jgi:hypothetical protein
MNRIRQPAIALVAMSACQVSLAAETLGEAVDETKYLMNWRVRSEIVDQTGIALEAHALTSRIRFGLESGSLAGTRILAEASATTDISSEYNSTTNGQTQYPVVADPGDFVTVNRFAILNNSLERTVLTLGRQRYNLDDMRFVGNVGWRQHEQTLDGLFSTTTGEKFGATVGYAAQVNRVFGPESAQGKWNGDIFIVNVSRTFGFGKLTGFAYGLEIDESAAASTDTLGFRLAGSRMLGESSSFAYTLSYAEQSEAGLNPATVDESYSFLEAGFTRGKYTTALGLEVLSGNGTTAFSTPLATLHVFQGWADKFLTTPVNGIADSYVRFAYSPGMNGPFDAINLAAWYHVFDADFGSAAYGDEIDVSISARVEKITLMLKYAAYEAESLFTDTDKLWFSMEYAF